MIEQEAPEEMGVEPLDREISALLSSQRALNPVPDGVRARLSARLGASLGFSGGPEGGAGGQGPAPDPGLGNSSGIASGAAAGGLSNVMQLGLAAMFGVAVGAGGYAALSSGDVASGVPTGDVVETASSTTTPELLEASVEEEPVMPAPEPEAPRAAEETRVVPPAEPVGPERERRNEPISAPSPEESRRAERELLTQAQTALARGQANGALEALADYRERYPRGVYREESAALRVQALRQSGQHAHADSEAARFLRSYPNSIFRSAVSPGE